MLGASLPRLLREPLVHFYLLAAALFLVHRALLGDAHTIELSRATRATVARHFRDQAGRAPTASELDSALRDWGRDEALYREALREGLDRDDSAVRTLLIDKMRARAALQANPRTPTPAELEQWLAEHRTLYETPRRYTLEWLTVPRAQSNARLVREQLAERLRIGENPRFLDRPLYGANLDLDELRERLGDRLAARVDSMPPGAWQPFEQQDELLLLRLNGVEGGLPTPGELQPRLVVDWSHAQQETQAHALLERIAARYRIEERP